MSTETETKQTEFVFNEREKALMEVMEKRQLSNAEAAMLAQRDKWYHWRKIVEKIIYMLPSIIYSISQLLMIRQ